jgi:hypothetical protein
MAQLRMAKLEVIQGIPFTVAFRTAPCKWILGPKVDNHQRVLQASTEGIISEETKDGWQVRDAFLNLKTEEECLAFLNQTGIFSQQVGKGRLRWSDFLNWQEVLREFLKLSPPKWAKWLGTVAFESDLISNLVRLHIDFTVQFRWEGDRHFAMVLAQDTLTAILATIYIDHLRRAKFKFCARLDCRRPFELTSKHKRIYCSQYCAHLESVRALRARRKRRGRRHLRKN